jgi:CubicO group peptidase (beta-lactamase class C family)
MRRTELGTYLDQFSGVASIFSEILRERPDSGAALSIWKDGKCVLDLHGGFADKERGLVWGAKTPSVIFSSTKGIMSLLLAMLFQEGLFDYEDRVGKYWPEYARGNKENTLVKDLISHRAGLPAFKGSISLEQAIDWNYMVRRIEQEDPLWEPGEDYFYHAISHGWLLGELISRLSLSTPGAYLQSCISKPLEIDCWIGIPPSIEGKVANLYVTKDLKNFFSELKAADTVTGNLLISALTLGDAFPDVLVGEGTGFNATEVHKSQIPGAGGIATANALAKLWSSVVVETDGVRLLTDETISYVTQVQSEGVPFGDGPPPYSRFGLGFQLDSEARRYLTTRSFGHDGAGGQCAFADPVHKVGFAFLTNEMDGPIDTRATRLIEELAQTLT